MSMPKNPPDEFRHAYNENCIERRSFNEQELTQSEYWEIWSQMHEHKESRK
tara:strand:+ start:1619 stop:1771 length:153 start_codon:yes stop_codon:yes gene_type:complete